MLRMILRSSKPPAVFERTLAKHHKLPATALDIKIGSQSERAEIGTVANEHSALPRASEKIEYAQ